MEVPGVGGMVALVDDELVVDGELVVPVPVELVVGVVDELEDVLELDEVELELEDELVVQSWPASWLTVLAPWPRLFKSVGSTVDGRWATALFSAVAALCA
ncbi:MAG TPA: hypothetical protein VGI07_03960 [Solirubrobacteraceae bacterium]